MKKNIVVVDIDGTISNPSKRIKHILKSPKDWDSFYKDVVSDDPIQEVVDCVNALSSSGYEVVFCTGRRESCRVDTVLWINKHFNFEIRSNSILLMRKENDKRDDFIVKPELLKSTVDLNKVAFILEDRQSVVSEWRSLGLICFQVAEGNF